MIDRLEKQISFLVEVDQLKQVLRQTYLVDMSRQENDAEHSWHLALMAMLLSEYAADDIDVLRVVKMVLVHDVVEIDAGDTFAYDEAGHTDKEEREQAAAQRIFNLLPGDLAAEVFGLWEEFEARETPEAKFAAALDRFQPILLNHRSGGLAWQNHGIHVDQVMERNRHMDEGAPALWSYAQEIIEDAVRKGYLESGMRDGGEDRPAEGC
ncbi:MAG: HD domain-containing protein [bacterium]|nr:HD domain-containing protein [bacterium]